MQKHSDAVLQHSNSKRCVAIVNPAGAHGKSKKLWSKLSKVVTDKLTPQGFVVEEVFTSGPDSAARLASEAAAAGAAVVLAVGGDGTIHEVRPLAPSWEWAGQQLVVDISCIGDAGELFGGGKGFAPRTDAWVGGGP